MNSGDSGSEQQSNKTELGKKELCQENCVLAGTRRTCARFFMGNTSDSMDVSPRGRPAAGRGWLHSPPSLWQFALNLFLSYLICTFLPAQLTSVSLKCPSSLRPCLQPSRRSAVTLSLGAQWASPRPRPSGVSLGAQEKAEPSTGCCLSSRLGGGALQQRPPEKGARVLWRCPAA